ncbi:LacI family DNA-binding transcriptional regulator [Sphingomonas sp.]|jgi:DNA-binding LacI/PurR family transcriptional regulator|uniref:LacI family DNA-binding transcriptional regulator n=1 Tax=Sphingomonas sp. TaxID=28214 RepID=UPI0035636284
MPPTPTVSTLAELAELAGVSVATVSRSLAGNTVIAESTRTRIVALAREHGFQVNQAARNLRLRRTGAIGVVLPLGHEAEQHLSDPFFMSLLGPLADAIADRGHDLLLSRIIPKDDRWLDAIVDARRVDGVIVIGQSNQIDAIERVARRYRPMVVWGADMPDKTQITIGSDNVAGGRMAAEHLLAQGRTRLAFFGNIEVPEFAARYAGFQQALAAAGGGQATLLPVHLTSEASYSAIENYLAGHASPDGIVAASDVIAMSALRALAGRGKRVPQDVSVIGYDDVLIAMHTNPPLTTVRQDVARGAAILVDLLFRRMEGEEVESVAMTPELILRASA